MTFGSSQLAIWASVGCVWAGAQTLVSRASSFVYPPSRRRSGTSMALTPFHLAFPVHNLDTARHFYGTVLGCSEGRSSKQWIDFDLFGHQIVAHLREGALALPPLASNPVDGHSVPIPHFGVVLPMSTWQKLAEQLRAAGTHFIIEPYIRFKGEVGEQATMFFLDPSGNALEFKAFADIGQIFAK